MVSRSSSPRGLWPQKERRSLLWTRVLVCSVLNLFLLICPSVVKVSGEEDCRAGAPGGDADRERRPDGRARAGAPEPPVLGATVPLSEGSAAVSPGRALPGPPRLNGSILPVPPRCFSSPGLSATLYVLLVFLDRYLEGELCFVRRCTSSAPRSGSGAG